MTKIVHAKKTIRLLTLAVILVIFTSCSNQDSAKQNNHQINSVAPNKTGSPPPTDPIDVEVVNGERMKQIIQKHLGNVVLLDYWATW